MKQVKYQNAAIMKLANNLPELRYKHNQWLKTKKQRQQALLIAVRTKKSTDHQRKKFSWKNILGCGVSPKRNHSTKGNYENEDRSKDVSPKLRKS